jgi:lipopolysaccharide export system protein LptA
MKQAFIFLLVAIIGSSNMQGYAQKHVHDHDPIPVYFKNKDNDTLRVVNIWNANRMREETKDSSKKFQSLVGAVELQEDNTYFYCDSVVINQRDNIVEAFGNVHINDSDTTNIYSQYMKYLVDKKYAIFQKKVRMVSGSGTLLTDDLQYDMNLKIGTYFNGGKVINSTSVLTSKEGTYYADTKDVYFKKDVLLKDPAYDLRTDSLLYNTQSQIATFVAQTFIKDSSGSTIQTKEGNYDLKQRRAQFGKRPTIKQGSQQITGEDIKFDDAAGISIATGNAVYKDTAEGISILANYLIANKKTNTFLATQNPLMILKQDNDSIFVTADTLFSGKLSELLYADSIRRHNDSIKMAAIRKADSLHSDSIRVAKLKLTDSLKNAKGQIDIENPKETDDGLTHQKLTVLDTVKAKQVNPPPLDLFAVKDSAVAIKDSLAQKKGALKDLVKDSLVSPQTPISSAIRPDEKKEVDSTFKKEIAKSVKPKEGQEKIVVDSASNDSTNRYLQAYHHVRIFSDSLQAVADSLFYSAKDSIFRLFTNPIVWANGSQVTGDTIYLYTKSKKPSRLYVFENALVVNKVGNNLFNQIKGNTLNGYFKDGVIDNMRAKGNAENIYFLQDDGKAFVGVNQSKADVIDFIFVDKEINKVVWRNDVEGTTNPIKKVNFDELHLRNFKWMENLRPKSRFELFGN